jgi:hypothetical protein
MPSYTNAVQDSMHVVFSSVAGVSTSAAFNIAAGSAMGDHQRQLSALVYSGPPSASPSPPLWEEEETEGYPGSKFAGIILVPVTLIITCTCLRMGVCLEKQQALRVRPATDM